ncbi:flagellar hook-length control protein FliK [Sphingomonas albertensis]|uniref:Flagellar hook-length control protein FliK n=1 Tax=Sphingomonas albertensis TaxID=2762591 RepID=A0ABR7AQI2_9SPHN|nr:flagellar hook-length control protein FliK [Sphingomonas albertensis]MBC3942701.1 flagellar hook-length control protein FliK [Sphingomonas albertensis]
MIQTAVLSPVLPAQTRSPAVQNGRTVVDFADSFAQANDAPDEGAFPGLPPAPSAPTALVPLPGIAPDAVILQDAAVTGNVLPIVTPATDQAVEWQPMLAPHPAQTLAIAKPSLLPASTLTPKMVETAPPDGKAEPVAIPAPVVRIARPTAFAGIRRDPRPKDGPAADEVTEQPAEAPMPASPTIAADMMLAPQPAVLPLPVVAIAVDVAETARTDDGTATAPLSPGLPSSVSKFADATPSRKTGKAGQQAQAAAPQTEETTAPAPIPPPAAAADRRPSSAVTSNATLASSSAQSLPIALATLPPIVAPPAEPGAPIVPTSVLPSLTGPASTGRVDTPALPEITDASPVSTGIDANNAMTRWGSTDATAPVALAMALPDAIQPQPGIVASASQVFGAAIQAATRARDDRDKADPTISSLVTSAPVSAPAIRTAETQQAPLDMRQDRWPHAMIERIEILRDAADAGDTRIRLIPDALGAIDVSMRKDGDTVRVHFHAEQSATRTLLQDAQPRLVELAEARGLKLAQGSLGQGSLGQGSLGQGTPGDGAANNSQHRPPATPQAPTRTTASPAVDAPLTEDTRIA